MTNASLTKVLGPEEGVSTIGGSCTLTKRINGQYVHIQGGDIAVEIVDLEAFFDEVRKFARAELKGAV